MSRDPTKTKATKQPARKVRTATKPARSSHPEAIRVRLKVGARVIASASTTLSEGPIVSLHPLGAFVRADGRYSGFADVGRGEIAAVCAGDDDNRPMILWDDISDQPGAQLRRGLRVWGFSRTGRRDDASGFITRVHGNRLTFCEDLRRPEMAETVNLKRLRLFVEASPIWDDEHQAGDLGSVTVAAAGRLLGVSPRTVRRLAAKGGPLFPLAGSGRMARVSIPKIVRYVVDLPPAN